MPKSVVSIVKGMNAEKMVEEALNQLGGVTNLIKPGSSVVIKPNAIGGYPPERAGDTSPAVISAVIKELRKAGYLQTGKVQALREIYQEKKKQKTK